MVTGGPVAHRASRNSFVAAFSYGGCFCGRILRRMLSRHQPHRLRDIKLFAGHCPRRKRALPQDDGLPLLSVTAFVTGQQWCLCTGFVGLGCTTRANSAPASPSRQTLVRDTTSLQKKPWRASSVQTRGFPGTVPRCSWVQSECGRACCAKGGGLRLRPSQLWSLLSCYRRGQAVLGVTAFVTCEQRCLCTGFVCLDCIIEDSNTSWQGVRGWEDAILAGCPARLNVQLCCFCRVPLVREEVVTLQGGASSPHKSQTCSWDTVRVPPLCAFRPLVAERRVASELFS